VKNVIILRYEKLFMASINSPKNTPRESVPAPKMERGAVCKEGGSPLTAEKLRALRHEIEQGKISKNAAEYNYPETRLNKNNTLSSILEAVFTQQGAKAPKSGIERIELALTANGLNLEKLKADAWKVDHGKLIFLSGSGKQKQEVFMINLLPWAALEGKENEETLIEHYYDLGVYKGAEAMPSNPDVIQGGVDATRHSMEIHKPQWYKDKVTAATFLLKIYDSNKNRFDAATQKVIEAREKILRELAAQTDFSWEKMRANFEKKHTTAEVFGAEGVYNLVLSFQRILDAYDSNISWLTAPDSKTLITLVIGKDVRKKEERYVKAIVKKGNDTDEPPVICEPPSPPEEDTYRDRSEKEAEHLAAMTDRGKLLPTSAQFKENIDPDVASNALLESYAKGGTKALVEGLKAIPDAQRQVVLDSIFKKLGEQDPEKAFNLMKEIIKEEKGAQETAVYEGLKENMDKAPDQNQKDFWHVQMLLFETSQAGDIDAATGNPRLSMRQSQDKMREAIDLIAKIDAAKLPDELQEMFKQQKQYLETTLRQGLAADYVETATMIVESMMKNRTDKDTYIETSFESLKKMSREEIKKELNKWYGLDNDSEVYMSSMHVLEALRLAVTYQYPQDVAAGKKIENPIEYYFNEIKNGTLTEIKLNDGASAEIRDVLLDQPAAATGKIDLNALFVDKGKEFDLFDQYQKGEEKLGEDSFWNTVQEYEEAAFGHNKTAAKLAAVVSPLTAFVQFASDERTSFMENQGGLIEGSKLFFPKDGDLAAFMKDAPTAGAEEYGNLGATEKLQMYKILQLISMKHFDEARSLCIQALQHRLEAKKQLKENDIKDKSLELQKDYGEKIAAQVRIQLEEQHITNEVFQQKKIPRPGGGFYTDLIDYINDRVKGVLDEMARIRLQGEIANSFTDQEVAEFSQYERAAYEKLQYLNGHTINTIYMTAEHADVVHDVAVMVAEIILIELVTLGAGTYFAGAAGVGEGAGIVARVGTTAVRMQEVGVNVSRGSRVVTAINEMGRTGALAARIGRGATGIGGAFGSGVRYLAEGETIPARLLGTYLHGASFAELQSLMRGRPVNPTSLDGQMQIATTALTMYGIGKLNQFTRGATAGARMAESGTLTGWRALPGVRNINILSNRLGQIARTLDSGTSLASRVGSAGYTAGEIGLEVVAFQGLGQLEQEMAVLTGTMTEDQKKAMYDPDAFNRWAHTVGVVLGLRTWRVVKERGNVSPEISYRGSSLPELLGEMRARGLGHESYRRVESTKDIPTTSGDIAFGERSFSLNDVITVQAGTEEAKVKVRGVDAATGKLRVAKNDGTEILVNESDIRTPKTIKMKVVEFLDENGNPIERNVKRERDAINRYLNSLPKEEMDRLNDLSEKVAPMQDTCRVSVNIPAFHEGKTIYKTLSEYIKQVGPDGKPLDPSIYEINVAVNREASTTADNTYDEVVRFKTDHPEVKINVIDIVFPDGQGGVGAARKVLTDLTLKRSVGRTGQEKALYIESEDADLVNIDPKTVWNIIEKMDNNAYLDAVRGVQDRTPEVLMQNDLFFLNRRADDFGELLARQRKYRPHVNPNYDFTWNRTVTGGWNTAYSAEIYAKIGGYASKMRMGEDMYIGQKISIFRGQEDASGNFIPETGTVDRIRTRTDSSPRRYLEAYASGSAVYAGFGESGKEDAVRGKSNEKLLDAIKPWERISMQNKGRLEWDLTSRREFLKATSADEKSLARDFDRLMFFLGFKKGDYRVGADGKVEILNVDNVAEALKNYRAKQKEKKVKDRDDTSN